MNKIQVLSDNIINQIVKKLTEVVQKKKKKIEIKQTCKNSNYQKSIVKEKTRIKIGLTTHR